MKTLIASLTLLLILSVGLNITLWRDKHASPEHTAVELQPPSSQIETTSDMSEAAQSPQVSMLEQLQNAPQQDQTELKSQWLQQSKQWLAAGRFLRARDFIQQYLQRFPDDIDFLLLEAELIANTEDLHDVLAHYYATLELPLTDQQAIEVQQKIDTLVRSNVEKLSAIGAWDILTALLEPLWQYAPTRREYIVWLSEAYARQAMENATEYVLASLDYNDPDAIRIRSILDSAARSSQVADSQTASAQTRDKQFDRRTQYPDSTPITLLQTGDHFIVQAKVEETPISLLLDTGASTTALSQETFNRVASLNRTRFIGDYRMNTAGGQIQAPVYQVSSLQIHHARVDNIAVVVLDVDNFAGANGLLGMNFLREFDFQLDQQQALLYLR